MVTSIAIVAVLATFALGCGANSDAGSSTNPKETSALETANLVDLRDGSTVELADFAGTPVVLNLWASWCAPCRAEMPAFQSVQDALGEQVQIVGVTAERDQDQALEAADTTGVSYPLLVDVDRSLSADLGVTGMPSTFFLNAEGQVIDEHPGVLDEQSLTEMIGTLYGIH